jgi:hypothetical protein
MRMTKTEAKRRAAGVIRAMPKWSVHAVKSDGTVLFMIDRKSNAVFIEFSPEHWAAFDAVANS